MKGRCLAEERGDVEDDEKKPTERQSALQGQQDRSLLCTPNVGESSLPITPLHSPGMPATGSFSQERRESCSMGIKVNFKSICSNHGQMSSLAKLALSK